MSTALVSHRLNAERGADLARDASNSRCALNVIVLPEGREKRLPDEDCAKIDIAFFSAEKRCSTK